MVILGDFNGVLDPLRDRAMGKSKRKNNGGKLPQSLFDILEEENLTDIWSVFNETLREYTYFSSRHKSHSRLDLILTSKNFVTITKKPQRSFLRC